MLPTNGPGRGALTGFVPGRVKPQVRHWVQVSFSSQGTARGFVSHICTGLPAIRVLYLLRGRACSTGSNYFVGCSAAMSNRNCLL